MTSNVFFFNALTLALFIGISGCNSSPTDSPVPAPTEGAVHNHGNHDHDADSEMTDMEKMEQTLAKLPEADRKSAMEQHICPVSGEMLGTMGLPKKMEVEGQTVWICCDGCEKKLQDDPEKYLAKLNQ
ncbi:hypothetical protein GYB59_10175 [bacterium]|nr:hypothetical protein [bacterium]